MSRRTKYQLPAFLLSKITQAQYEKWLRGRALAHFRRDRNRGNRTVTNQTCKQAIHLAVLQSKGRGPYTGEVLNWSLIGKYNNHDSSAGRRQYKVKFALMPSVDHNGDGLGNPDFRICAWRTNDPKNDLNADAFVKLCRKVASHLAG